MKDNTLKNLFLAFVLIIIAVPGPGYAQSYKKELDNIVKTHFKTEGPGGSILVTKGGDVIYKAAYGKANLELNVAMQPDHVFRIASLTKQFTAAAILKLAEQNKLSLQDSITKFIADYPAQGHYITIEHLLTHTSGIKNYTGLTTWTAETRNRYLTSKQLIELFKDEPLDFPPGTEYRYSNSGYVLLGYIIEVVSGQPYAQYMMENFFRPLRMRNSQYDFAVTIVPNRAPGYQHRNGEYENAEYLNMTLPYAAGGLLSSVEDFSLWQEALFSGKVLKPESLVKAHTSYTLKNGMPTGYGYGWVVGNIQGSRTVKHDGRINGFTTFALYLPTEKISVAIFSNCECADNLELAASKMAAIVLGKPFHHNKMSLSSDALKKYQGVYNLQYGGQRVVLYENERLVTFHKGGMKTELTPFEKDKFFVENGLATFHFTSTAKNDSMSLEIHDIGLPITGVRTGEPVQSIAAVKTSAKTLTQYVGQYQFSGGPVFSIVLEGDKLYGQVGQDKKEILPFGEHQFFAKELDAHIIFQVDANGKVVGLTKIQNGTMQAKRIP